MKTIPLDAFLEAVIRTLSLNTLSSSSDHHTIASVLVTALVLLFSLLVAIQLLLSISGLRRRDIVLFCGPMNAGKTVLFYQLKQGIFRETHASMIKNTATFQPSGCKRSYRFIDTAGHPSHRHFISTLINSTKCVVFVVDGSDTASITAPQTVNYLFSLLTNSTLQRRRTPVLICVNKSDDNNCPSLEVVKEMLQSALDKARQLQSTIGEVKGEDEEDTSKTLGSQHKPFDLKDSRVPIDLCCISAKQGRIQSVIEFLNKQ